MCILNEQTLKRNAFLLREHLVGSITVAVSFV